jgi:hypothetical protein
MGDISEKDISGKDIYWVPLLIRGNRMGRETTTEQSLGLNATKLVGWAYRDTHETSNQ